MATNDREHSGEPRFDGAPQITVGIGDKRETRPYEYVGFPKAVYFRKLDKIESAIVSSERELKALAKEVGEVAESPADLPQPLVTLTDNK